jgi:hypothetical protein
MKRVAIGFAIVATATALIAGAGGVTPAFGATPRTPSASGPVQLYVVGTGVKSSLPCTKPHVRDMIVLSKAVYKMLQMNLPSQFGGVTLRTYQEPPAKLETPAPDILQPYIGQSPKFVAIATVCKTFDVTNLSIAGYDIEKGLVQSGSMGGTFDSLESSDRTTWANLFGTATPGPVIAVPNIAFLPVGNDPNGIINPRLLRNLPLTVIATPPPLAPTAAPAAGAPAPPATPPASRIDQCNASAYHMLITGRVPILSQSTDVSRAIIAGGSLKWSQPEWNPYYTSAGLVAGLLYNPNSAEIGVDIFVCPPSTTPNLAKAFRTNTYDQNQHKTSVDGKAGRLYEVGGINHHIVGHKTTPAIGTDPFAQQRAEDKAVVDLANQLDCIISQELNKMGILTIAKQQAAGMLDPISSSPWCNDPDGSGYPQSGKGYFAHLEMDFLDPALGNTDAPLIVGPTDTLN